MKTALPLKFHGGKQHLAKRIIELFPPRESYLHFVEPFFGGGAVLFHHDPEGKSEVANDIYGPLTNFWRVLAHPQWFPIFQRLVQAIPFSERFWGGAMAEWWPHHEGWGDVEPAVRDAVTFFVLYRQSRQGLGKDFATLSRNRTRRGMNEQASSWLSAVECLPEAHERLRRVVILNRDALDVIRQQDGPKTVFYCDPPYLPEVRASTGCYENEMEMMDHVHLLETLATVEGKFLLSGYRSEVYDYWSISQCWDRVDIEIPNHSSSAKTKEIKTECVWKNY